MLNNTDQSIESDATRSRSRSPKIKEIAFKTKHNPQWIGHGLIMRLIESLNKI